MREGRCERRTREVEIMVYVCLDGPGELSGSTRSSFMDHMLGTLSKHGSIRIDLDAKGDLRHHIIEDTALVLGEAMIAALGDKAGIRRFGDAYVPMDDSLARAVVDLGGRAYSKIRLGTKGQEVEDAKLEDVVHFLESLAGALRCNMHIRVLYGTNDHHRVEAAFKALALALREAFSRTGSSEVPSAKGVI